MNNPILEADKLTVRYGRRTALDGVSAAFAAGEAVVIAGSNGAGKSTLLRCLAGAIIPDRGRVVYGNGLDKAKIGFVSDRLSLYEHWTLREAWRFHKKEFGIAAAAERPPIEGFSLDEGRKIRHLSVGERTLFHLSLLLAQRPAVLLIDEVVHGLDPFLRDKFLETVIGAMDELKTAVIMVNHTLSDTAEIPERVLIMAEGRIILDERRDDLMAKVKKIAGDAELPPSLPVLFETSSEYRRDRYIYPFHEEWRRDFGLTFTDIGLDEIVKAFIGGSYVQKRTR
ncbi:MAG: ABC transporter ATP-binding protein [Acidobacteriota bacterium]|nr:ABC transporter ATP-binding protein [Acidobacteriota bacterium]